MSAQPDSREVKPNTSTPMKAIRAKCLECSNLSPVEVRECPITDCPLHAYRLGKNPNIGARPMSEEQKGRARARMQEVNARRLATTGIRTRSPHRAVVPG